jgi:hypothetical protein
MKSAEIKKKINKKNISEDTQTGGKVERASNGAVAQQSVSKASIENG